jgi:hypothetical protein
VDLEARLREFHREGQTDVAEADDGQAGGALLDAGLERLSGRLRAGLLAGGGHGPGTVTRRLTERQRGRGAVSAPGAPVPRRPRRDAIHARRPGPPSRRTERSSATVRVRTLMFAQTAMAPWRRGAGSRFVLAPRRPPRDDSGCEVTCPLPCSTTRALE